jgi:hypothetical protein
VNFVGPRPDLPILSQFVDRYARLVCQTNRSRRQATRSERLTFVKSLIAHGFQLGLGFGSDDVAPHDRFRRMNIRQLRVHILNTDSPALRDRIVRFCTLPAHLSLDPGVIHGHTILDCIVTTNAPTDVITNDVLYDSVDVVESIQEF